VGYQVRLGAGTSPTGYPRRRHQPDRPLKLQSRRVYELACLVDSRAEQVAFGDRAIQDYAAYGAVNSNWILSGSRMAMT
jgi:hypothetical protein